MAQLLDGHNLKTELKNSIKLTELFYNMFLVTLGIFKAYCCHEEMLALTMVPNCHYYHCKDNFKGCITH